MSGETSDSTSAICRGCGQAQPTYLVNPLGGSQVHQKFHHPIQYICSHLHEGEECPGSCTRIDGTTGYNYDEMRRAGALAQHIQCAQGV